MRRTIPLPRGWNRRVKSAVLQILALSHYTFASLVARAAHNRDCRTRLRAEIDRLHQELVLLQDELRIKDARMARLHPHRRPFYTPVERMAILEMRAGRGWSAQQTADRFFLTLTTVGAWMSRIHEEGPHALLRLREPVNKFPDLVRHIVQRLKLTCPPLGKVKIAEMLCRAGLHLAPTTVGRMLRDQPVRPEPIAVTVAPVVRGNRSNHVWHLDLTAVPTRLGFWVPRRSGALPQEWPFCWWVVVVLDHFSRRVQGFQVFAQKPDARALSTLLGRTVRAVGGIPNPRLELRARWPVESRCASPQAPMDRDGPHNVRLEVSFLAGRRHLPIVSLRRAA